MPANSPLQSAKTGKTTLADHDHPAGLHVDIENEYRLVPNIIATHALHRQPGVGGA
jgi:hypothetical protein